MKNECYIEKSAKVESGATITGNSEIRGDSFVESGAEISDSLIINSHISAGTKILKSVVINSKIYHGCEIGPFAHIRGGCEIFENCKIGNFVEIKNSKIGARTKACHLTYIGDAMLGTDCNVGCGVIFANYNGIEKFKTIVGDRVFIGCNTTIVAPCQIDDESFIAAGSTVTKNIPKRSLCIARSRQENKEAFYNPYLENFKRVKEFFGTDGIRGIAGKELCNALAKVVGNALCQIKDKPKILIGRDTRPSGSKLEKAFISGAILGGAEVYDLKIVPTPCVSYLTKKLGFDFGVVITASHNPAEYNGIKIFGANGIKITDEEEVKIESKMKTLTKCEGGKVFDLSAEVKNYENFLKRACKENLSGLKIVLDCACGASYKLAPKLFKRLGAEVIMASSGGEINKNCGCTHLENLKLVMEKHSADLGFAFDGDADRVIAMDKNLNIIDGDKIIYLLALWHKKSGKPIREVVGTVMTNSKIEELLLAQNITLKRTPVGDKYIIDEMLLAGQPIGGEQAGHIIQGEKLSTGDGMLTALSLTEIYAKDLDFFEQNTIFDVFPQENAEIIINNIKVKAFMKNESVVKTLEKYQKQLSGIGRMLVRPSGTEPKIRIMVESKTKTGLAKKIKKDLEKIIQNMA